MILFRILRHDEIINIDYGIFCKDRYSNNTVLDHVLSQKCSKNKSKYISMTKDIKYAFKGMIKNKSYVAIIYCSYHSFDYIDLTLKNNQSKYLNNNIDALTFVKKQKEVLAIEKIPSSCIYEIISYHSDIKLYFQGDTLLDKFMKYFNDIVIVGLVDWLNI